MVIRGPARCLVKPQRPTTAPGAWQVTAAQTITFSSPSSGARRKAASALVPSPACTSGRRGRDPMGSNRWGQGGSGEERGQEVSKKNKHQRPSNPQRHRCSAHTLKQAHGQRSQQACARIKRNHKAVFPHAIHDNAFLSRLGSERILVRGDVTLRVSRSTRSTDQRRGYGPRPEQGQWDKRSCIAILAKCFNPFYVPDNRVLTVLRGALRSLWEFNEKDSAVWYLVQSQCSEGKAWTEKIEQVERC